MQPSSRTLHPNHALTITRGCAGHLRRQDGAPQPPRILHPNARPTPVASHSPAPRYTQPAEAARRYDQSNQLRPAPWLCLAALQANCGARRRWLLLWTKRANVAARGLTAMDTQPRRVGTPPASRRQEWQYRIQRTSECASATGGPAPSTTESTP